MTTQIILVTGPHCHLCEQAKAILYPLLEERQMHLLEVSIQDNQQFAGLYGLQIHVVLFPNHKEKGWPFTAAQIARVLDQLG